MQQVAVAEPRWQLGLGRENGLAFWGLFFIEATFGSFFPIWPLFMEELGAPISIVGVLLGLGGVFRLCALLPTAAIARRFGARQVLIVSRLIAAAAIGAAAIAPSWPWLIPVLIGSSVGSMAFPLVMSHISANSTDEARVRAFSLIVTIGPSVALLITPVLSSVLISQFGLRAPFVLAGTLSVVAVNFLARFHALEELDADDGENADAAGYRAGLQLAPVRNVLLLQLVTVFALGIGTQLLPNYLRDVGNFADSNISLLSSVSAIGTIGFGTLVVRNQRFSSTPLLGAALAVILVGLGFLLFLMPSILPFVILGFVFRGGVFASITLYSAVLGERAPARNREHIFTMSEIFIVIGFSFAPVIAGVLFGIDPSIPLIVAAICSLPIFVILLKMSAVRRAELGTPE